MPLFNRSLFIVFLSLCSSCLKPIDPTPPQVYSADYWGTVTGTRSGKPLQNPRIWAATRTPCNAHSFDIFITEFTDRGEELVTFTLVNLPQRPISLSYFRADYKNLFCGTDTLGSTLTAKANVGYTGTYKPCPKGNRLVIASFDSVKKEITGSFRLNLVVDERQTGPMPDTIKLESGQFRTRLRGPNGKYE